MRTLKLTNYRKTRIWMGELPDAVYPSIQTLTHVVSAGRAAPHCGLSCAAIELIIPRGPHFVYGLLGGEWKLDTKKVLTVNLNISTPNERSFSDSLANRVDIVRVGLPAEYAQAVLAGVDLAGNQINALAAGTLSINCAAHGVVSSCDVIYKHLAITLIKLLHTASNESSDEDLTNLFPAALD